MNNNPSLSNIDPVKLKLITELMEQNKGNWPENILAQILKLNGELEKRGMGFTNEESDLITDFMLSNMNPQDKQKATMLINMFKSYNKK